MMFYDEKYKTQNLILNKQVFRRQFAYLSKNLVKRDFRSILDVGCGTGEYLEELIGMGFEGFGLDFARSAIDKVTDRGLPAACADYFSFKPDKKFDLVLFRGFSLLQTSDRADLTRVIDYARKELLSPFGSILFWTTTDFTGKESENSVWYNITSVDMKYLFGKSWRTFIAFRYQLFLPDFLNIALAPLCVGISKKLRRRITTVGSILKT